MGKSTGRSWRSSCKWVELPVAIAGCGPGRAEDGLPLSVYTDCNLKADCVCGAFSLQGMVFGKSKNAEHYPQRVWAWAHRLGRDHGLRGPDQRRKMDGLLQSLKTNAHTSSIAKIAKAVLSSKVVPQDVTLWPTEAILRREGLLFHEGGTHSRKMVDVINTLNRLKSDPGNFSQVDSTKLCRKLNEILLGSDEFMHRLLHLQDRYQTLRLLIDSGAEDIMNQASDCDSSDFGDLCYNGTTNKRNRTSGTQQQLLRAVMDANDAMFGRLAAEVPSQPAEMLGGELLSKIARLRQEISVSEDELFAAFEMHIKERPSTPGEHRALALPVTPDGGMMLHHVFLLGLQTTGLRLIKTYFDSPELVSTPVKNDLDHWRIRPAHGAIKGPEVSCSAQPAMLSILAPSIAGDPMRGRDSSLPISSLAAQPAPAPHNGVPRHAAVAPPRRTDSTRARRCCTRPSCRRTPSWSASSSPAAPASSPAPSAPSSTPRRSLAAPTAPRRGPRPSPRPSAWAGVWSGNAPAALALEQSWTSRKGVCAAVDKGGATEAATEKSV